MRRSPNTKMNVVKQDGDRIVTQRATETTDGIKTDTLVPTEDPVQIDTDQAPEQAEPVLGKHQKRVWWSAAVDA